MTKPVSNLAVTALASLVHEIRPEWEQRGIAWAIHKLGERNLPLADITIAFVRGAVDETNETPAALVHLDNRAWESNAYPRCKRHPLTWGRRKNGECGGCYADRMGVEYDMRPAHDTAADPHPLESALARLQTTGAAS